MNITDKTVLSELKRIRCCELNESIDGYPEDERDGRSDMQVFADELSWILSNYAESGHSLNDDLEQSKEILRETKNGKVMPLWKESLTPVYRQSQIQSARNTINEHMRLQNALKRLHEKGIRGQYE